MASEMLPTHHPSTPSSGRLRRSSPYAYLLVSEFWGDYFTPTRGYRVLERRVYLKYAFSVPYLGVSLSADSDILLIR